MKECVIDIETTDLDPKKGKIICIGLLGAYSGRTKVFFGDDERILLEDFLNHYSLRGYDTIIGYNILGFDLQYIFIRCLKNKIPANRFLFAKHIDLMHILRSYKNGYGNGKWEKLETWLQFLMDQGKMPIPYSVKELYQRGNYSMIIKYNKQDVRMTFELYKLVKKVLWNG